VLVIGGGQAGLAMGHHLARRGLRFEIVDAGAEIGAAWRSRWDSLRLFTSGRYDNLPGLPFPAAPDTYPGKDDVAHYLQAYAARFKLPVRLNTKVESLTRSDGGYLAKAGSVALEARHVVVATGPFQVPFIPPIASGLDPGVRQLHSAHYRRPETVPSGKVLVVGAANSGCQIAQELSATDPAPGDQDGRTDGDLFRRQRSRLRRRGMGDRVQGRPYVDRHPRRPRPAGTHPAHTRRDAVAGPVHARPDLAAHPRLCPAWLGRRGRGVPRRADSDCELIKKPMAPEPGILTAAIGHEDGECIHTGYLIPDGGCPRQPDDRRCHDWDGDRSRNLQLGRSHRRAVVCS
jgi:glycine/D-amino acid oxidase-like deaminating enzyme